MFRKRRSSKQLDIKLYARFRENHPDIRPGTSAPIHLSVAESEHFIRSRRTAEDDAQNCETTVTPTSEVPWLSSGNTVSVLPTPLVTDESALKRILVAQLQEAEKCNQSIVPESGQLLSPTSEHDMWSDFILPEHLSTSEAIGSCIFQDFTSLLVPQASFPETLASTSLEPERLSPLATEDVAGSNLVNFIEPLFFEIADYFYPETGSTEPTPSAQLSNGARFHHSLDAPPALILKGSGGSPVTYLNRGSQYSISVEDTLRADSNPGKKVYCTSVHVVFDTEQQRQEPLAYWQLWEQNRDDDEVLSAEGRSLAIEYVDPQESDHQEHVTNLQVVHSDGFSLMWSADHNDMRQFSIPFRLNFRSTDFTHCKGVIGVAMQLSSRTEEISACSVQSPIPNLEMSFCRIKSFRSHGAERKNTNDMAIAEKRIKRLKQQLKQSQTRQTPKDKRLGRDKSKTPKLPGARRTHESGLLCKIVNLQHNCTSTQSCTFLDQQGEKQQDCDWLPSGHWDKSSGSSEAGPTLPCAAPPSCSMPMAFRPKDPMSLSQPMQRPSPPWYEDSRQRASTQDPPERGKNGSMRHGEIRVACFYIRPIDFRHISQNDHYIAVYLFERTARDLTRRIAEAVSVEPGKVGQTIWSTAKGINVLVDDDVVANIKEGQKMQVEGKKAALRSQSGRRSSHNSASEVYCREHGDSQGTQELLEFKLVF